MRRRARTRTKVLFRTFATFLGSMIWLSAARAAPPITGGDFNVEQRLLIAQLTADKAIMVARERRMAAADQEKVYEQLKIKDRALRAAERRATGNAAKLAELRKAREQVARERQVLVAALVDRDRTLAVELRMYREMITGVATSLERRKQQALQRFADGEQREALADLDVIRRAKRATQNKALDIQDAAEARPAATLALQAHDQCNVTLDEAIRRYEELTRLDPGTTWDWIELARLYEERGQLDRARHAAEIAYREALNGDDRDIVVVLNELGDLALQAGDLAGAKAKFEDGLIIRQKLTRGNPNSLQARRDVSTSLERLGDVALQAGDLTGAKARFEESLTIACELATDSSNFAQAQRDVSIVLERLGDVALQMGDLLGAKARFAESLVLDRKVAEANPSSAQAQRDVSVSLGQLGSVAMQAGDLAAAMVWFEENLMMRRKLAKDDPSSARAQRDVSISLNKLGDAAMRAGDPTSAKARFEESLTMRIKLAKDNPSSAEAQRDVGVSLERLGDVALQTGDLADARMRFENSLTLRRKLAQGNLSSAQSQRDVCISLGKLGDVAVQAGDPNGAKKWFAESLTIARELAKDSLSSAQAQRDLLLSLARLGQVARDRALVNEALTIARELERTGRVAPSDRGMREWLTNILDSLP